MWSMCGQQLLVRHVIQINILAEKPLDAHFTYWNSVTYWPEDGLR